MSTATVPLAKSGPRSRIIIDIAMEMQREGYLPFLTNTWRKYGDLAHMQIGPGNVFLVTHPDHVRHVNVSSRQNYEKGPSYKAVRELLLGNGLVASTGDLWRRQRRLMAPFFTPRAVEQYYKLMVEDGDWFIQRWNGLAGSQLQVEMINEMMIITARIILRTMFSMHADEDIVQLKGAVETMISFTARHEINPFSMPLWMPTPPNQKYKQARQQVHTYIDGLIAQRRAIPQEQWPEDLLGKLMGSRDEESGEMMPDDLVRDEAITMFFAGHETTARTLSFMWYALSQNPEVAEKLHEEIDRVVGDKFPSIDDLKQLPYTLQVIKETLRLYPPAPIYARDAVGEDVIDGVTIPAGARMLPIPWITHRHPDFWENPEAFDPERWTPEREAQMHPYQYHPFAAGQRICIGNNFSLFESHLLTTMLARRFAPLLKPGHKPRFEMAGTLSSLNGLPMTIRKR